MHTRPLVSAMSTALRRLAACTRLSGCARRARIAANSGRFSSVLCHAVQKQPSWHSANVPSSVNLMTTDAPTKFTLNFVRHHTQIHVACGYLLVELNAFDEHRADPSHVSRALCTGSAPQKLDPKMKKSIESMVAKDKVVLFMKGTPEQPMCGFSRAVALVLQMHAVPFSSYDVLQDETLRTAIKLYSDWPTIPQLYVNGEFVGGCDIVVQMHQQGEITDMLDSAGVKSKYSGK